MVFESSLCLSARSSFVRVDTLISSSVLSMSALHCSHFSYSSFCCVSKSDSILSITSLTLVKASNFIRTASEASAQFLCRRATSVMCCIERKKARSCVWDAAFRELPTCKKLTLAYRSRESSSVSMPKASPRATNSSPLAFKRSAYSSCSVLQFFFRFIRNSSSADSASIVASLSSFAFAASAKLSARAASFCSCCSVAALISLSFATRRFWNEISAFKSSF
mmetsp:Transcript_95728/g.309043  ORF Transcript_95728/g.309043 Transcript_95728/m.309043 type:complete len:222 (+) Transcript_95728:983-1648(+)